VSFKARDFIYDAARKSLFVWLASEAKTREAGSVVRWDLPADIEAAFEMRAGN
jgi:hypothetical protein